MRPGFAARVDILSSIFEGTLLSISGSLAFNEIFNRLSILSHTNSEFEFVSSNVYSAAITLNAPPTGFPWLQTASPPLVATLPVLLGLALSVRLWRFAFVFWKQAKSHFDERDGAPIQFVVDMDVKLPPHITGKQRQRSCNGVRRYVAKANEVDLTKPRQSSDWLTAVIWSNGQVPAGD